VDVTAANSGNSATSDSSSATITNATDLIFGANLVQVETMGPGGSFTQRLLTSPDGDIAEDQMVAATGSYSANATLNTAGPWIMQMVAFRTPPISYVQGNFATPQTPQTTMNVAYTAAQVAGDLNVVVWGGTTARPWLVQLRTQAVTHMHSRWVPRSRRLRFAVYLLCAEHRIGGCRGKHRYRDFCECRNMPRHTDTRIQRSGS